MALETRCSALLQVGLKLEVRHETYRKLSSQWPFAVLYRDTLFFSLTLQVLRRFPFEAIGLSCLACNPNPSCGGVQSRELGMQVEILSWPTFEAVLLWPTGLTFIYTSQWAVPEISDNTWELQLRQVIHKVVYTDWIQLFSTSCLVSIVKMDMPLGTKLSTKKESIEKDP